MRTHWTLFGVPCFPGAGILPFLGGGWGPFRRLETGFVGWEPNHQKTVLAVTRRHGRVFGNRLAHGDRSRVAQLSCYDDVGRCYPRFSRKTRLTGFWRGSGTWRNSGPQPTKKNSDPPKIEKRVNFFAFHCGFKNVVSSKTERFLQKKVVFALGVRTENT